jgi:hypothetical protein
MRGGQSPTIKKKTNQCFAWQSYQGVGNGLLLFWDQPMREKNQHCLPDELQATVIFKLSRLFWEIQVKIR